MNDRARTIEALNELIQVNEDRSEGYTHVSESLKNEHNENIDLLCVFRNFAVNSLRYTFMLKDSLLSLGVKKTAPETTDASIVHAMQHVKDEFKGSDTASILTSCEAGERATLTVFQKLMETDLPREIKEIVRSQQEMLLKAYSYINEYRNELLNPSNNAYNNEVAY